MAPNEPGAEDDDHGLAGDVFSEMSDVVGTKRFAQPGVLPHLPQNVPPEESCRQQPEQVDQPGDDQPEGIEGPFFRANLLEPFEQGLSQCPDYDDDNEDF